MKSLSNETLNVFFRKFTIKPLDDSTSRTGKAKSLKEHVSKKSKGSGGFLRLNLNNVRTAVKTFRKVLTQRAGNGKFKENLSNKQFDEKYLFIPFLSTLSPKKTLLKTE